MIIIVLKLTLNIYKYAVKICSTQFSSFRLSDLHLIGAHCEDVEVDGAFAGGRRRSMSMNLENFQVRIFYYFGKSKSNKTNLVLRRTSGI